MDQTDYLLINKKEIQLRTTYLLKNVILIPTLDQNKLCYKALITLHLQIN